MTKLGLIAGGGALPVSLANHCSEAGRPFFVLRLAGFAGGELEEFDGVDVGLGELGKALKTLKAEGCKAVCLAGTVPRPDFSKLKLDLRGVAAMPGVLMAARKGDDGLLTHLVREFEKEGFAVEGAHQVMGGLTLGEGPLGRCRPAPAHEADIARAMQVAREIGRLDIGQGAVCCEGLILAVEAQEGTDAMLRRVSELPGAIRGSAEAPRGVLAKVPKPGQDPRVDLPTIGVGTIHQAARAGLAGVAGEAGKVIVLDKDEVIDLADQLGLFVVGVAAPAG